MGAPRLSYSTAPRREATQTRSLQHLRRCRLGVLGVTVAILNALGGQFSYADVKPAPQRSQGQVGKKPQVRYKSHTEIDFANPMTVQGKARTPDVFYIYQRNRSEEHRITVTPSVLSHQQEALVHEARRSLPQ